MNSKQKKMLIIGSASLITIVIIIVVVTVSQNNAYNSTAVSTNNPTYCADLDLDSINYSSDTVYETSQAYTTMIITDSMKDDNTDYAPGMCSRTRFIKQGNNWVKDNTDISLGNQCYKNGDTSYGPDETDEDGNVISYEMNWSCPVGSFYYRNDETLE